SEDGTYNFCRCTVKRILSFFSVLMKRKMNVFVSFRLFISVFCALCLLYPSPASAKRRSKSKRKPAAAQAANNSHHTPEHAPLARIYRMQGKRLLDPYLKGASCLPSSKVVKAAILAVGRIADPEAVEELAKIVNRKNKESQKLAAFSLGLIGTDVALKILEQQ